MRTTRALAATATLITMLVSAGVSTAAAEITWESSPGPHTFGVDVTPVSYMTDRSGSAALRVEHIVDEQGRPLLCVQFDRPSPSGNELQPLGRATPQLAYLANLLQHPDQNPDLAGLDAMQQYYVLQFVSHMYNSPHFAAFTDVQDGQPVSDPHGLIPRIQAIKAKADASVNGDFFEHHRISVSEAVPASQLDAEGYWVSDPVTVTLEAGTAQASVAVTISDEGVRAGSTLVDATSGEPVTLVTSGAVVRIKTSADSLEGKAADIRVGLDAQFDGGTAKIGYLYGGNDAVQQIVGYDEIRYNEHLATELSTSYSTVTGSVHGIKTDTEGTGLAGVEFTLKSAEGDSLQTVITADDGSFSFTDIAWGTWYIHETKTPEGFIALPEPIEVVIDGAHREISLGQVSNDRIPVDPPADPPAKPLKSINTGVPLSLDAMNPATVATAVLLLAGGVGGGLWNARRRRTPVTTES